MLYKMYNPRVLFTKITIICSILVYNMKMLYRTLVYIYVYYKHIINNIYICIYIYGYIDQFRQYV